MIVLKNFKTIKYCLKSTLKIFLQFFSNQILFLVSKFYQQQSNNKRKQREWFIIMPVCTNPNMVICLLIVHAQS